eukprot:100760-Chlamydomonas_euryale.AAC.1
MDRADTRVEAAVWELRDAPSAAHLLRQLPEAEAVLRRGGDVRAWLSQVGLGAAARLRAHALLVPSPSCVRLCLFLRHHPSFSPLPLFCRTRALAPWLAPPPLLFVCGFVSSYFTTPLASLLSHASPGAVACSQ